MSHLCYTFSTIHIFGRGPSVEESEAPVAETSVAVEPRELHGELLLLGGLQLGDVHGRVQHAKLEVAVEAAVCTGSLWVNLEAACLLWNHCGKCFGPAR